MPYADPARNRAASDAWKKAHPEAVKDQQVRAAKRRRERQDARRANGEIRAAPGMATSTTYERRKASGVCVRCGQEPARATSIIGEKCHPVEQARNRRYREMDPNYDRRSYTLRKYGITRDEWEAIFVAQGRRCGICGRDSANGRGWATDHDHETGQVRGILCHSCNTGIGQLGDSLDILARARRYLRRFKPSASLAPSPSTPQLVLLSGGNYPARKGA